MGYSRIMRVIVVAAKPAIGQDWLADAAAQVALQTGARAHVVSLDGVDLEALSPMPRREFAEAAQAAAEAVAAGIRAAGVEAIAETRPGRPVPGILLYAEEQDAELIIVGATSRGRVAQRLLGAVPLELVSRSRRPVLVVSGPTES
jgi:nucleotide-binding universal stress UspA family protein